MVVVVVVVVVVVLIYSPWTDGNVVLLGYSLRLQGSAFALNYLTHISATLFSRRTLLPATMPAPVIQKGLEGFAEAHAAALDELSRNKVLAHSVNWDTCANAGVLSPSLVAIIKSYDKKPESEKQRILKDNGQQVVEAILSIVAHVKTPDILKYALALADETINFDDKNIGLFLMCQSCTDPLFSILDSPPSDLFTIATAVQVLSHCLVHKSVVPEEDVKRVLRWVSEQLSSKEKDVEIKYLLGSLQVLLRKDKFRVAFLSLDGLHLLGSFLRLEKHFQILYQVIYCIWLLTYNHFVADRVSTTTVIHKIVDVLKNTQKEKVIRVCLAALRNMMDRGENNQQMIEAGLVKLLDLLKQKKWGDEDIVSDLEALLVCLSRREILL